MKISNCISSTANTRLLFGTWESVLASKPTIQGLAEVSKLIPIISFMISSIGLLWTHVEDTAHMPSERGCIQPAGSTARSAASHTPVIPSE